LGSLVVPPIFQGRMWWAVHQTAGRPQPGQRQPRSRAVRAGHRAVAGSGVAGIQGGLAGGGQAVHPPLR
jgi:hypothetical protein